MEHEYKAGDWVRIIDVDEISGGRRYWKNGDICRIKGTDRRNLMVDTTDGDDWFFIRKSELHAIQPIGGKPKVTKYLSLTINEEKRTSAYEPMTIHGRDLIAEAERLAKETYLQSAINVALDTKNETLFLELTKGERIEL